MNLLLIGTLLFLLLIAAWQDFRSYRISNALVFPGALLGVFFNTSLSAGIGFFDSIGGWGFGLLLLLPFFLLRAMAAGDVKLMAMVGAFLGQQVMISVFLYVLVTGGVLALIIACSRGILQRVLHNILLIPFSPNSRHLLLKPSANEHPLRSLSRLPYGVAITAGTIVFLFANNYLYIAV